MKNIDKSNESFRDTIATVDKEGKRVWIYPQKPKGKFYIYRLFVAFFLLLFFFIAPHLKLGGHQLLLFNILDRHFVIFGLNFWPQDFYLFALVIITFIVFIVLFTAIFGRLWCGWACPQTVFMELVYRRIEYWIEGNALQQRKLNRAPWTANKIFKKTTKHLIFLSFSFVIGNTLLAYLVGSERLVNLIQDGPAAHLAAFMAVLIYSLITYGVFARFREQICFIVCPYGRFQSVLLDDSSIVVAYDFKRGEQRRRHFKNEDRSEYGDCIECNQCVAVCPTGIDIRNGTQLECVNCTACIDACDSVMDRVKLPKGLIRYTSYNNISQGTKFKLSARIIGYSAALIVLLSLVVVLISGRSDLDATILRTPGVMAQEQDNGTIRNLYAFKAINKTSNEKALELKVKNNMGTIKSVSGDIILPPDGLAETVLFIDIPKEKIYQQKTIIIIDIYSSGELIEEITTSFLAPRNIESDN